MADTYLAADTAAPTQVSSAATARGCVVPGRHGRTIAAARARLRAPGCTLGSVRRTRARHGAPTARIIRQTLGAGSQRAAGAPRNR